MPPKHKTPRNIMIRTINNFNRKDITNEIIIFTINQQLKSTKHNI